MWMGYKKPFRKLHWRPGERGQTLGSRKQEGSWNGQQSSRSNSQGEAIREGAGSCKGRRVSGLITISQHRMKAVAREAHLRALRFQRFRVPAVNNISRLGHGGPFFCSPSTLTTSCPTPTLVCSSTSSVGPVAHPLRKSEILSQGEGKVQTRGPHALPSTRPQQARG